MSDENKKEYKFGELKEYDLEKIEQEVLKESVYLDVFAGSDPAFKTNISAVSSIDVISKLNKLNVYSYQYDTKKFPQFADGQHFGLMADEVESVFPSLVKKDEKNHGYINYQEIIPLLLGVVKDLSAKVEVLEKRANCNA